MEQRVCHFQSRFVRMMLFLSPLAGFLPFSFSISLLFSLSLFQTPHLRSVYNVEKDKRIPYSEDTWEQRRVWMYNDGVPCACVRVMLTRDTTLVTC